MRGRRQPGVYGRETLADIEKSCRRHAKTLGLSAECCQWNSEGELVGWIQAARGGHHGIVVNPGAYSHTSIAIMDAFLAAGLPVIEVHLSNIHRREAFRHHSYVSKVEDADRKSVVEGKSVSERVDLGGGRTIKKKRKHIK